MTESLSRGAHGGGRREDGIFLVVIPCAFQFVCSEGELHAGEGEDEGGEVEEDIVAEGGERGVNGGFIAG